MPTTSLVAVHAQKCPENANVLASPSLRHRAGKYDENVMDVNTFDVLLLVLVGLLVLLGVLKGLTRLLIGVGALVAAFMLTAQFHWQVAVSMARVVEMTEPVANLVAYLAIFLGTMLAGALIASALGRLLRATMLGWADRRCGGSGCSVARRRTGYPSGRRLCPIRGGRTAQLRARSLCDGRRRHREPPRTRSALWALPRQDGIAASVLATPTGGIRPAARVSCRGPRERGRRAHSSESRSRCSTRA